MTSDESVAETAKVVGEQVPRLDVLVNNAGVGAPHVSPEDTAATDLRAVFEANVPASKSALNMVTVQYAHALDGIKVNAVDPGYTATDAIVRLAGIGADGPTGGFFNREGSVSW